MGRHLCQNLFLNKVAGTRPLNLLKNLQTTASEIWSELEWQNSEEKHM